MFDLKELSEWDKAESVLLAVNVPQKSGAFRTLQRVVERDDQGQCPFGFTKEAFNGQD